MKYLFLDLDNTVTESRSLITAEMFEILSDFPHVVIVSGASAEQIRTQIGDLPCHVLAQNGNSNSLYERVLTGEEEAEIMSHLKLFAEIGEDQLEHRGAQISYSFVGHNAPLHLKKAFDPTSDRRRGILAKHPLESELVEVRIGGTTCFDYFPKGLHKGYNIGKYIELLGWNRAESLYVGDALFPGGNDESVIGVIPTFAVKNPAETLNFLKMGANIKSQRAGGETRQWGGQVRSRRASW